MNQTGLGSDESGCGQTVHFEAWNILSARSELVVILTDGCDI